MLLIIEKVTIGSKRHTIYPYPKVNNKYNKKF